MNEILNAADEVRKLNRMFQGLAKTVEVLDRIGTLEQAETEAKVKLESLDRDLAAKEAEHQARMEELAEQHAMTIAAVHAAIEEAEATKAQAMEDAQSIREQASKDAAGVLAAAEVKKAAMEAEIGALEDKIKAYNLERSEVEAKLAEAQSALDVVLKRLGVDVRDAATA